eukprot:CAMPEP_0196657470 /NCGR_PEP_ID=MMETSP1086-20130531/23585_1 /TAXON_ID=77921 /ORGANISM="Cyanoptyche  gloeocystis , Strain SAG4.97" /LENGTH=154 /DNA_ID=CAMNT_0041990609 /DNA_START=26 /DNA_END=487 /DNA_ORIENTATION=-
MSRILLGGFVSRAISRFPRSTSKIFGSELPTSIGPETLASSSRHFANDAGSKNQNDKDEFIELLSKSIATGYATKVPPSAKKKPRVNPGPRPRSDPASAHPSEHRATGRGGQPLPDGFREAEVRSQSWRAKGVRKSGVEPQGEKARKAGGVAEE